MKGERCCALGVSQRTSLPMSSTLSENSDATENSHLSEFFVVALPGLEAIVANEIKQWFPNLETKVEHGGITVFAPLELGMSLNLVLKTATRILLRVKKFRCRDFPKLYNFIVKIPWGDYIEADCEMSFEVSTRLSRLKMKNRIAETCQEAWTDYATKLGAKVKRGKKATMFVRLHNDDCVVSLDTSGERLHKRGVREHIGEAPLRESIAASLVRLVIESDPEAREVEVIDPMLGSGTFLLEALTLNTILSEREFGFEVFVKKVDKIEEKKLQGPRFVQAVGYEFDKKTFAAAKKNLDFLKSTNSIELNNEDFYKSNGLPNSAARRWVFCNPPYGERIKIDGSLKEYYERLFAKVEDVAKPDRACFLLPSAIVKGKFILPTQWKVQAKLPFINGGIPVTAFVFARA